jgi:hypothetical protein
VGGRASHTEGLPPSAADKDNGTFDDPIDRRVCAEVDMLKPTRTQDGKSAQGMPVNPRTGADYQKQKTA